MRSWPGVVRALPAAVLLVACSGGGDGPSLAMDRLARTGRSCPVGLAAAVEAGGLGEAGADVRVEVESGSGEGGRDAAAIDRMGGVYVECTLALADGEGGEGGEVTSHLVAAEQPGAINLLLPLIAADLQATADAVGEASDRFAATEAGELVDLGADGPAAAARIEVDGAESAVVYVSATAGAASPAQVRAVVEHLLDGL